MGANRIGMKPAMTSERGLVEEYRKSLEQALRAANATITTLEAENRVAVEALKTAAADIFRLGDWVAEETHNTRRITLASDMYRRASQVLAGMGESAVSQSQPCADAGTHIPRSPERSALWSAPAPAYCPDGLTEEEFCPACGADPRPAMPRNWCRARHSGPAPRSLVKIILTHRDTGEPI